LTSNLKHKSTWIEIPKRTTKFLPNYQIPSELIKFRANKTNFLNMEKVLARAVQDGMECKSPEAVQKEYERFLMLCAGKQSSVRLVPSPLVDKLWHAHILHTKLYADKCQSLGCEFIHHQPADEDVDDELTEGYRHTLEQYAKVFGELPPGDIWPQHDAPDCKSCHACGEGGE